MSVVVIDCKGSVDLLAGLRRVADRAGMGFKFFSIEDRPGRAWWNPLAHGDWSVNKDRLMDVEEWSEPFYKGQVETALQTVLRVMSMAGTPATLRTVHRLLGPGEFRKFVGGDDSPYGGDDRAELCAWMEQVAKDPKRLSAVRDMQSRIEKLLGSVVGPQLVPGGTGDVIDLLSDTNDGTMVVFSLSAPSYPIEAERIATWVARELQVLMSARLTRPAVSRRPTVVLVDEFPAVPAAARQFAAGYQMAREAGISYVLSCQSAANLDTLDDLASATQITANARLVIAGRDREGAELTAKRLGTIESWEPTMQTLQVGGFTAPTGEASTGVGSQRRVDSFVIHPNVLRRLPDQQVVVSISGQTDADGVPVLAQVCHVAPHHDHPLVAAPAEMVVHTDADRPRWRFKSNTAAARGRRWLPTVAAAGGLFALAAVPALYLRDTAAPAAAAPAAVPVEAVSGPAAWATVVMHAWTTAPGETRDRQLVALIGTTLDPAPLVASAVPTVTSVIDLDAGRRVVTFLVAGDDGSVSGWAVTVAGPPWQLVSLPVPIPAPAAVEGPGRVVGSSLREDTAATVALSPILTDFFTVWGRGTNGDRARLAALTDPGVTIRPIGGLTITGTPVMSSATPKAPSAMSTPGWCGTATARRATSSRCGLMRRGRGGSPTSNRGHTPRSPPPPSPVLRRVRRTVAVPVPAASVVTNPGGTP